MSLEDLKQFLKNNIHAFSFDPLNSNENFNINDKDSEGNTLLIQICKYRGDRCVNYVLENYQDVDINIRNNKGFTALTILYEEYYNTIMKSSIGLSSYVTMQKHITKGFSESSLSFSPEGVFKKIITSLLNKNVLLIPVKSQGLKLIPLEQLLMLGSLENYDDFISLNRDVLENSIYDDVKRYISNV